MKLFKFLHLRMLCLLLILTLVGCSKSNDGGDPPKPGGGGNTPNLPRVQLVNGNDTYGYILDESKNPIPNVVVTDGFSVVKTDDKGIYQLKRSTKAKFVYYSTPAEYEIAVETNDRKIPLFYRKLMTSTTPQQHDFSLRKKSTVEKNFTLIGIGDPQVTDDTQVGRFVNETIADIKSELASIPQPTYGIALGDIVNDKDNLLSTMKMRLGSMSMPVFTTIGNHDKFGSAPSPKTNDLFENTFGPTHYSYNIGDVHFICLDNVVFSNNSTYGLGISQDQVDWLEKNLVHVPKDKMLIVYYHMPIRSTNFATRAKLISLLKEYKEIHLMCGHTHYNENFLFTNSGKEFYEHIHGAACGAWWRSNINGDGTPNGYMIYRIEGSTMKDWIYKPTKLSRNFQFRLHWGNIDYSGAYGTFNYGQPTNTLIANIWNADKDWKAEVHMDGQKIGDMTLNTAAPLNKDAWSMGYHIGVLNRSAESYDTTTKHLYTFPVVNPNNTLKVIVTDRFGNTYEQTYADIVSTFDSAWKY